MNAAAHSSLSVVFMEAKRFRVHPRDRAQSRDTFRFRALIVRFLFHRACALSGPRHYHSWHASALRIISAIRRTLTRLLRHEIIHFAPFSFATARRNTRIVVFLRNRRMPAPLAFHFRSQFQHVFETIEIEARVAAYPP